MFPRDFAKFAALVLSLYTLSAVIASHRRLEFVRPGNCVRVAVAMALSELSGDAQGIILGQLRNTLEPRLVMYFSSASKELRRCCRQRCSSS